MTSFIVHGPFSIEFEKRKGGRTLVFDSFWWNNPELQSKRGCYGFAIRNRGLTPIYVGKATKSFGQETFNAANRHKYSLGFSNYEKGAPVMYFVAHPREAGRINARQIAEVEDFLIQAGVAKNPDLQNVRGAQQPSWSIKGVVRGAVGRRADAETQFASLFDIRR
jgi:hypothetical protein